MPPTKTFHSLQHKAVVVSDLKFIDATQGTFEGYLAVFGNEDKTNDIIETGAFAKTLREAHEIKTRNNARFLYPLLWMHNPEQPIGGIYDASEDSRGLYIKGQCDLNTAQGAAAYSGMQMGYASQMSIGYDTVKATRDAKGTRHLQEVRLWEGSLVTTGFAANDRANILLLKSALAAQGENKGACGKTSWPLASRDRAWDSAGAHGRIIAWATNADDSLDAAKMQSVHFWYDPSAPDNITSYKLPFCDVIGGDVQAIPRGVMAVAGVLQGARGGADITSDAGVKAKVASYYRRMSREFDDPSIVAPWESGKVAWRRAAEQKMAGGLQSVTSSVAAITVLQDSVTACLEIIGDATGLPLDPVAQADAETLGDQLAPERKSLAIQPAVGILLDNLPGFKDALSTLADASTLFDAALFDVRTALGVASEAFDATESAAAPLLELKQGRTLSGATRAQLKDIADNIDTHCARLKALVGVEGEPEKAVRPPLARSTRPSEPEPRATTPSATPLGEPTDEATLESELADALLSFQIGQARNSL